MTYSLFESWLAVLLACFATLFWRLMGLLLARKIATDGVMMLWINAVAYAMVAGVLMLILVNPTGILSTTSLVSRFAGLITGIMVILATDRLFLAIISGILTFTLVVLYID